MRKCAVNWPLKHAVSVEAILWDKNLCLCWYVYLPEPCNWSHMVILLYFVSSTLPCNYHHSHRGFWGEAILPRLTQQINSAFWLSTNRRKEKKNKNKSIFNICYTCPSSLNQGIHECWIGCVFHCLRMPARANSSTKRQLQHQLFSTLQHK